MHIIIIFIITYTSYRNVEYDFFIHFLVLFSLKAKKDVLDTYKNEFKGFW